MDDMPMATPLPSRDLTRITLSVLGIGLLIGHAFA